MPDRTRDAAALLDRHSLPATFFVTGHTAETYPDSVRAVAAAGHEISHHGYLHETLPSEAEQRRVLERLVEPMMAIVSVRFTTLAEAADAFRDRHGNPSSATPSGGAVEHGWAAPAHRREPSRDRIAD